MMNTLIPVNSRKKTAGFINQCEQWLDTGRFYVKKQLIPGTTSHFNSVHRVLGGTSSQALQGCLQSISQVKNAVTESFVKLDMPIESRFYQQLLGFEKVNSGPLSDTESEILLDMERIMASGRTHQNLPLFSSLTPKLLKALREDTLPWPKFRALLDQDPLMKNRFFKATNSQSTFLKLPTSKDELRKILLQISIEMVIEFDRDKYGKPIRQRLTQHSLNTALAALSLSQDGYGNMMEAWLAGLSHNIAGIIIVRRLRHFQHEITDSISLSFLNELHSLVALLSNKIAAAWKLPPSVCTAIKEQGTLGLNSKMSTLGEGLYLATKVAMVLQLENTENTQQITNIIEAFSGSDRLAICESAFDSIQKQQH